jgi:hypothetical protein
MLLTGLVLGTLPLLPLTFPFGLTASCIRSGGAGIVMNSTTLKCRSALFSFLFHLSGALFRPLTFGARLTVVVQPLQALQNTPCLVYAR